jgi:hypothetical protein
VSTPVDPEVLSRRDRLRGLPGWSGPGRASRSHCSKAPSWPSLGSTVRVREQREQHGLFVRPDSARALDPSIAIIGAPKRLSVPVDRGPAPTLLEAARPSDFPGIQGRSLLPGRRRGDPESGLCYFETWFPSIGMRWASLKGVRSPVTSTSSSEPELYDSVGTPERENVYSARPHVVKELGPTGALEELRPPTPRNRGASNPR